MIDQIRTTNEFLTVAMFFLTAGFFWTFGGKLAGLVSKKLKME